MKLVESNESSVDIVYISFPSVSGSGVDFYFIFMFELNLF